MMLSVNHLSASVDNYSLLKDVSFSVQAGEVLAVLGPNGAGKTTLLNALTCNAPDNFQVSGTVQLGSQPIAGLDLQQRAKQIAVLPQASALNFPFTVQEVVELGRMPHSTGCEIDQAIMSDALQLLDIQHLQQRPYTQLSGGEKQRVQLARVMTQIWYADDTSQRLLILDEPTSSLDLGHQQQLMQVIRQFAEQGVGIIMVVHDINLASHYADQLLILRCGSVMAHGTPENIVSTQLVNTLYDADVDIIPHPETGKPVVMFSHSLEGASQYE